MVRRHINSQVGQGNQSEEDVETPPVDSEKWREGQSKDISSAIMAKALKDGKPRPEWSSIAPQSEETKTLWAQWDSLHSIDRILYRVWENSSGEKESLQVIVPKMLRKEIFVFLRGPKVGGHFGVNKTIGKVKERFYWPKLWDVLKDGALSVTCVHQERVQQEG